jgi:cell volume regulation protein A
MENLFHAHALLFFGAALALVGILSSLAASRFGMPLLLVFLGVGMLAGEDGPGGVAFNDYRATYMVGSAAIAIILFDGGLRTRIGMVRAVLAPAGLLASAGVLITAGITALAAVYLLNLRPVEGMLIGAIVASTDAAVVFFLMRTGGLQLRKRIGATLEVESGTNDPFAVLLTVMLVQVALGDHGLDAAEIVVGVVKHAVVGTAMGLGGGLCLVLVLNRLNLPTGLHPVFAVTAALVVFAATQLLDASGFLAVYVAGLVLGNRPVRAYASITSFHDAATWLCQIALFTMLGLLVTPSTLLPILLPAIGVALVVTLVARPVAVVATLLPFRFSRREIGFIGWVGLRGGVSIFLATIPTLAGLPQASVYFNVAFVVVVVSLLLQGSTIGFAARRLGVALREQAPEVQRIDIDLPGQLDAELVGYPLIAGSQALRHRALPSWVKPVLVIRDGVIMEPAAAGALQTADYAYFLAPTTRVPRLDRFFTMDDYVADSNAISELPFDGGLTIGTIADLYGLDIDSNEREFTIAELFADRLDGTPQENDRIEFGDAHLVAHNVAGDRVTQAGLQLEATLEDEDDRPAEKRLWRRLQAWLPARRR